MAFGSYHRGIFFQNSLKNNNQFFFRNVTYEKHVKRVSGVLYCGFRQIGNMNKNIKQVYSQLTAHLFFPLHGNSIRIMFVNFISDKLFIIYIYIPALIIKPFHYTVKEQ